MYSCYWQSACNRATHLRYNGSLNNHFLSRTLSFLFAGEKKLLKLVNIWRSYKQNNVWLSHEPHSFCTFLLKNVELARLLVYNRQKLLINVGTSRLIWLIIKYHTAVGNFWLTDWQTGAISVWLSVDHVRHFAVASFSLLQQFCTTGRGIFNIAAVNILLLVN